MRTLNMMEATPLPLPASTLQRALAGRPGQRIVGGRRTMVAALRQRAQTEADTDERVGGLDFVSSDHLSLADHPKLREAALAALDPHAGGSSQTRHAGPPLLRLEERLAALLCCREATVFPTGRAAAYGALQALVSADDHVLLDCLASTPLLDAARAATPKVHRMPHGAAEVIANRLARLRREAPRAGILVVADSVLPVDSMVLDLRLLQDCCRQHGARLLVRLGRDFGTTGDAGFGFLGHHGLIGEADVVIGSFTGAFAAAGGFAAARSPGLRLLLTQRAASAAGSAALSPVQAAVALAALEIVASTEGRQRRQHLSANIERLRAGLGIGAFDTPGSPSSVIPVILGPSEIGRRMTAHMLRAGAGVQLIEHPVVARLTSRWLLSVRAGHTAAQIDQFVAIAAEARQAALRQARFIPSPPESLRPSRGIR